MRTFGSMLVVMGFIVVAACHKDDTLKKIPPPVSVNVIHAMPKGKSIISMFGSDSSGKYYSKGTKVNYGAAQLYSTVSGKIPLRISAITDTTRALYNSTLDLTGNAIYSLFLAGDTTKPDTLFIRDILPVYTDSSAGVRFVNLATGGKSLNVNLKGDLTPVSSLGYLHAGDFLKYPANSTIPGKSYKFEVRDAATGDSLTTFTWAYTYFSNNTIVIAGSTNPADGTPLKLFSTKNY